MNIDHYVRLFNVGIKVNKRVDGLAGRVLRGIKDKDFETLSDDPDRKIIFYIKEDGLRNMFGKTVYEILYNLGYEPNYFANKIKQGNKFKLIIFSEPSDEIPATWDNLLDMIVFMYPKTRFLVYKYRDKLKITPFCILEELFDYSYLEVEKNGINDQRFMTYERLDFKKATFSEFRAFLYFTAHVREYYSGDGFTNLLNGDKVLKEYITPNVKLSELIDYRLIDLSLG